MNAIDFYRVARKFHLRGIPVLPKLIERSIFLLFNSYVPCTAEIGEGTRFGYGGMGVVIHANARIGKRCTIGPQVTIGGRSRIVEVPVIGDDVFLATGSKILGPVTIGDGAIVGANAVVIHDVPARSIVAGVPAKVIKTDIDVREFI